MSDNLKPDERAKSIINNSLYFTGDKSLSKELALWICQLVIDQKLKIDDKIYWVLVQEEIYKL
jgi:hypothetical protein